MGNSGYCGEAGNMKKSRLGEKGFTLVELLVALVIMGLVGLTIGAVLIQLVRSNRINQGMMANRQVQVAGDRVSQDGVQSQYVTFSDNMTSPSWFLNLRWQAQWLDSSGTINIRTENVTYSLASMNGSYKLNRREIWQLKVGTASPTTGDSTTAVALYLVPSQMSCKWATSDNLSLAFKVVAVVGTKTEMRTYNITPRP
jgi:prepilin-type N-terminal cleavage/methylation domain-containing protein